MHADPSLNVGIYSMPLFVMEALTRKPVKRLKNFFLVQYVLESPERTGIIYLLHIKNVESCKENANGLKSYKKFKFNYLKVCKLLNAVILGDSDYLTSKNSIYFCLFHNFFS